MGAEEAAEIHETKEAAGKEGNIPSIFFFLLSFEHRVKRGVAKILGKFYQTTGMRSIPEHRVKRGVAKTLGKFYQTTGMRSIPEHRVKRGVAL
ncbi:MAG: hypothetical protein KKD69_05050 [Euryarchaeota archaeon]|nr:hypothetical protein [Euryarchaeota archaeon]